MNANLIASAASAEYGKEQAFSLRVKYSQHVPLSQREFTIYALPLAPYPLLLIPYSSRLNRVTFDALLLILFGLLLFAPRFIFLVAVKLFFQLVELIVAIGGA